MNDRTRQTPRAITGLGVCSVIGVGREAFFEGLRAPTLLRDRKPAPIVSFDASKYEGAKLAEVPDFDATKFLGDKGLRTLDRLTKLLVVASRLALHDSGLKKDGVFVSSSADRVGVVCSNAYGSLEAITELNRVAVLEDARELGSQRDERAQHEDLPERKARADLLDDRVAERERHRRRQDRADGEPHYRALAA